jgi:hypothetical protein
MPGDQASDGLPTDLRSVVSGGHAGAVPPTCHGRRGAIAHHHDVAAGGHVRGPSVHPARS